MKEDRRNLKIAVVGSGVAGLTAAWLLDPHHQVTLLERDTRLGGHTHTVCIPDGPDAGTPVDTGFIVYNPRNYPQFIRLLERLDIQGQPSDMSFSFSRAGDFEYSSYVPRGLLAQPSNLLRPAFYGLVAGILRFNREAVRDLEAGTVGNQTLGEYLEKHRLNETFKRNYLLPMGAAIWSTPPGEMMKFPAATFLRFFYNHGLLALKDRPHWLTIPGGSRSYIEKMKKDFRGEMNTAIDIETIERSQDAILLREKSGKERRFDYIVIATHADQALPLLKNPSPDERKLLGVWRYTRNETVLHTDESAMPKRKNAWASWNYLIEPGCPDDNRVSLTYHMNRLQNLKTRQSYFVTLNRRQAFPENKVIRRMLYTHPCYTRESLESQKSLPELNGKNRTFFCGSYFGYGFHEDAVKSALQVVSHFGISL